MRGVSLVAVLLLGLTACQQNISPDSYAVNSVGQVNRSVRGTVISARVVDIQGTNGLGATAGAGAGAVGGSAIGGGTRANIVGAIGGAVVGGLVGAAVERSATEQQGMEYVIETTNGALLTVVQGIETTNGALLTVVQGIEPRFGEGDRVIVLYGARSRVIADPSSR